MTQSGGESGLGEVLQELREADKRLWVFGARNHRYKLGSALPERYVRAAESAHEIALPTDYRAFLQTVGNGGAGPYYGLKKLSLFGRTLSKPFPFTKATSESPVELSGGLPPEAFTGIMELCEHGRGVSSYLVVNGPAYGTIWDGYKAFHPTGLRFDAWFRQWAHRALRILNNVPVTRRLRVGMSKADVMALAPADWKVRQTFPRRVQYLESTEIPVQIELNEQNAVTKIRPWMFI